MSHQTKIYPIQTPHLFVMDNLYPIHALAMQLLLLTDGESKIIVTTRINTVDALNSPDLKDAMKNL